jgi:hypothetical protein
MLKGFAMPFLLSSLLGAPDPAEPVEPAVDGDDGNDTDKDLPIDVNAVVTEAKDAAGEAKDAAGEAKDAAEDAKKTAEDTEQAVKELDAKLDELAAGKFIEHGITGGVGIAVQIPIPAGTWKQESADVVSLPYVQILPWYWRANRVETHRYCASQWTRGQSAAQEAADELALKRAKITSDELIAGINDGTIKSKEDAHAKFKTRITHDTTYKCAEEVASGNGPCTEDSLLRLISSDDQGWTIGVPSGCFGHKLGLWVGVPISTYKTRISGSEFGQTLDGEITEVRPRIAFGLGISVNAWFTLLLGATYGTLDIAAMDAMGETSMKRGNFWAITVAPAFNIDLVRAFVRNIP